MIYISSYDVSFDASEATYSGSDAFTASEATYNSSNTYVGPAD